VPSSAASATRSESTSNRKPASARNGCIKRRKLQGHGVAGGGWLVGKADAFDLLVDQDEIGPEALVGAAQNQRRCAVAAIHQDAEFAQGGEVVVGGQVVEVAVDGAGFGRDSRRSGSNRRRRISSGGRCPATRRLRRWKDRCPRGRRTSARSTRRCCGWRRWRRRRRHRGGGWSAGSRASARCPDRSRHARRRAGRPAGLRGS
jgi:hypothetical protein